MSKFRRVRRERLAPVDAAWLGMERPENPMTITGVMILGTPVDEARLKSVIEDRLLLFDRFRQRIEEPGVPWGRPAWVDHEFTLRPHLKRVGLPEPRDRTALQDLVSDLMGTPLDRTRPLWQIHIVEDYVGGTALIIRIHHVIADGIALVRVLLSLTDDSPDVGSRGPGHRGEALYDDGGPDDGRRRSRLVETAARLGRLPGLRRVRGGVAAADVLRKLLALPAEQDTVLRGDLGGDKRAAWSDRIPLAGIRRIGRAFGVTVNDVMLAAVSGGVRKYLEAQEADLPDDCLRAVVPVNLRGYERELELGNRFGLVFVDLPVGVASPIGRLRGVHRRMTELKASPEARVVLGVLGGVGVVGSQVERSVVELFSDKVTMVLTNVPGPRKKLYLAGSPLDDLLFWVPQSGGVGVGVSIFSYDGQVRLGVAVDTALVPDPGRLVRRIDDELSVLLREAEAV